MKIKEIKIGGRYAATVSGKRVTLRVKSLASFKPGWFYAVNETTGREIILKSGRRLTPLEDATPCQN